MTAEIQAIIDDFEFLDEWEDKYRYIIELGRAMPEFDESWRTSANKVNGCVSQVWLHTEATEGKDPTVTFRGDSDAHIVRGLVAIMIAALSGKQASEIGSFDAEQLLSSLGLDEHISPQRANGVRAMIVRMRNDAKAALAD